MQIIQGCNITNNMHFDWMQIFQDDFLACCDSTIFYCLNHGTCTLRLNPVYHQSIQSFVYFEINRFDECGVEQDLNHKRRVFLPALQNRLLLFSWCFSDNLLIEKKTPELSAARTFRWCMQYRMKKLCKGLVIQFQWLFPYNKSQQRLLGLLQKEGCLQ